MSAITLFQCGLFYWVVVPNSYPRHSIECRWYDHLTWSSTHNVVRQEINSWKCFDLLAVSNLWLEQIHPLAQRTTCLTTTPPELTIVNLLNKIVLYPLNKKVERATLSLCELTQEYATFFLHRRTICHSRKPVILIICLSVWYQIEFVITVGRFGITDLSHYLRANNSLRVDKH